jgi:hypothetical protein
MRRLLLVAGLATALLFGAAASALGSHHRHRSAARRSGHRRHHARHRTAGHRRSHHKRSRHHKRTGHHKRTSHHRRRRHRHHRRKVHGAPAAPTPTAAPAGGTAAAAGPCPSGPPAATASLGGHNYALEGMDTFTKNAPLGSFAQSSSNQVVYTGDHGMSWTGYPDGTSSTNSGSAEGYQPSTVMSVHDGVLDFHLHNDAQGNPVGASPAPLPGGNLYQTYGAWSFCERVAPADAHRLADFHQAPLLWPVNDSDWQSAESDFPESDLNASDFAGFAHYGGSGSQNAFDVQSAMPSFDPTQWHVYTQTWGPGYRSYFVDGRLVGTSTSAVWSQPERWQLQIEPSGTNDSDSGDVYIKWVWIGTFSS